MFGGSTIYSRFRRWGYVSWDKDTGECYDFVPFKEKRIFRSQQEIKDGVRNRFVVFVKVPDEVSSDKNKRFVVDTPYWSIQNMTELSDVCVSSYVEKTMSWFRERTFPMFKKLNGMFKKVNGCAISMKRKTVWNRSIFCQKERVRNMLRGVILR